MRRPAKLTVALALALLLHVMILPWPSRQATVLRERPAPGEDQALVVDWTPASAESPAPSVPPTTAFQPGADRNPRPGTAAALTAVPSRRPGALPEDYAGRVRRHLAAYLPALPEAEFGEARVRFTVNAEGAVSAVELVLASGDPRLDELALALPARAMPLPTPGATALRLEVPVRAGSQP